MHEKLEKYLEEIGHYLAVNKEKEEILIEIKSHVLEKTEGAEPAAGESRNSHPHKSEKAGQEKRELAHYAEVLERADGT